MEGVECMSKKKLKITPGMLRMLDAIRENCGNTNLCIECPFHIADDPYNTCRLAMGMYPASWDLFKMEAESDG